jgi:hypothetical protein
MIDSPKRGARLNIPNKRDNLTIHIYHIISDTYPIFIVGTFCTIELDYARLQAFQVHSGFPCGLIKKKHMGVNKKPGTLA